MHRRNVCHRDIKLENLIYDEKTRALKIIDFGFASSAKEHLAMFCGTPNYISPEMALNQKYNGKKSDVWAAGIVAYTLLTGHYPFQHTSEKELYSKIKRGIFVWLEPQASVIGEP